MKYLDVHVKNQLTILYRFWFGDLKLILLILMMEFMLFLHWLQELSSDLVCLSVCVCGGCGTCGKAGILKGHCSGAIDLDCVSRAWSSPCRLDRPARELRDSPLSHLPSTGITILYSHTQLFYINSRSETQGLVLALPAHKHCPHWATSQPALWWQGVTV